MSRIQSIKTNVFFFVIAVHISTVAFCEAKDTAIPPPPHTYHHEKIGGIYPQFNTSLAVDSFQPIFQIESFGNTLSKAYVCVMPSSKIEFDKAGPVSNVEELKPGTILNYSNSGQPVTLSRTAFRIPLERVNQVLFEARPDFLIHGEGFGMLGLWYELETAANVKDVITVDFGQYPSYDAWGLALTDAPSVAGRFYYLLYSKKSFDFFEECVHSAVEEGLCEPLDLKSYPLCNFAIYYFSYDFNRDGLPDFVFPGKDRILYVDSGKKPLSPQKIFLFDSEDENYFSYSLIINPYDQKPYLLVSCTSNQRIVQSDNPTSTMNILFEYSKFFGKLNKILDYQGGASCYSYDYGSKLKFTKPDEITISFEGTNNPHEENLSGNEQFDQIYKRNFFTGNYKKVSGKEASEVFQ